MKEDIKNLVNLFYKYDLNIRRHRVNDNLIQYIVGSNFDSKFGDQYFFTIDLFDNCGFLNCGHIDAYKFTNLTELIKHLETILDAGELKPKKVWNNLIMELYTI